MKISILFDDFRPFHETKDPGQIPLGLIENGVNVDVLTLNKKELANYSPSFPILTQNSLEEYNNQQYWLKNDSDVILAYTWLRTAYRPIIEKIKSAGKKVIIKCDSDGRIAYPLERHNLRVPLKERWSTLAAINDLRWRLSSESWKRRHHSVEAKEVIKQIELSDAVIIESPEAQSNLNFFLVTWGKPDLVRKVTFIPNPIAPDFLKTAIGKKEKTIVSYGRWSDSAQKNTQVMVETSVEFLKQRQDFRIEIFGVGTDSVQSLIRQAPQQVRDRVIVSGFVERNRILEVLTSARILLVPSRWESFSIAAGEALCSGCSIVGTPVESLRYLSMQGFSGSTAVAFNKEAIIGALLQDAAKWDNGNYEPEEIAKFWRTRLDRKVIAKSIESLAKRQLTEG